MGQWGETRTEDGVQFVFHIDTEGDNPIRGKSHVDYLGFIGVKDNKIEEKLRNKYIGKIYLEEI